MKHWKASRFLSALLVLTMVVNLLPASVFALNEDLVNVALNATVLGASKDSPPNEGPAAALDGITNSADSKWCVPAVQTGWMAFELAEPARIVRVDIYHTESILNSPWDHDCQNTPDFTMQCLKAGQTLPEAGPGRDAFLADDANWTDIITPVTGNAMPVSMENASMEEPASVYRFKVNKSGLEKGSSTEYCIRIADVQLFAQAPAEPSVTEYTVSFEANGGTGTMEAVSVTENSSYPLPACGFAAPEGKEFDGWKVISPEGLEIVDGAITVTAAVTLQAQWKAVAPAYNEVVINAIDGKDLTIEADFCEYNGVRYDLQPEDVIVLKGQGGAPHIGIFIGSSKPEQTDVERTLVLDEFSTWGSDAARANGSVVLAYGKGHRKLNLVSKGVNVLRADGRHAVFAVDQTGANPAETTLTATVSVQGEGWLCLDNDKTFVEEKAYWPTVCDEFAGVEVTLAPGTVHRATGLGFIDNAPQNSNLAVYAEGTARPSPMYQGGGKHILPDGTTENCTVDHYEICVGDGSHQEKHVGICSCGHAVSGTKQAHTSDGTLHHRLDAGSHYKVCTQCGAEFEEKTCTASSYTDNGDTHTATCVCGRVVGEAVPHEFTQSIECKKNGTHTFRCVCGHEGEPIECTPSSWRDNEDGTHTPVCVCGTEFPAEAHSDLHPEQSGAANMHDIVCGKCGACVGSEACTPGTEFEAWADGTHIARCTVCGKRLDSTRAPHTFVWKQFDQQAEAGQQGVTQFVCSANGCGQTLQMPYSGDPEKDLIVLHHADEYTGDLPSAGLRVSIDGKPGELRMGVEESYAALEVPVGAEVLVTYALGPDRGGIEAAVVSGDGKTLKYYRFDLADLPDGAVLYSSVPQDKRVDYTPIEEALAAVPEDLSAYTPESAAALQQLLLNLPPRESGNQALVEEAAKRIRAGIQALVPASEASKPGEVCSLVLNRLDTLVITSTGYSINGAAEIPHTGPYDLSGQGDAVTVESGVHSIALSGLRLSGAESSAMKILPGASVSLVLTGNTTNSMASFGWEQAALHVPAGAVLVVSGEGTLTAEAHNGNGAGIGGNLWENCGAITFLSGTVTAISSDDGAGIGGGFGGGCGDLRFYGGDITGICCEDGNDGAGIGCGQNGYGGSIRIYGGNITGRAEGDDTDGAGIGGARKGQPDLIYISSGNVTGVGTEDGAGIGCGDGDPGSCRIIITGGSIDADSDEAAGIGGGSSERAGNITITNALIRVSRRCDENIGADSFKNKTEAPDNMIRIENISIFEGGGLLDPEDWEISPTPKTPDGEELMYLFKEVGGEDRRVDIILPDGTRFPAEVIDGCISVLVRKQNITADDLQLSAPLADYSAVDRAISSVPEDLSGYTEESVAALNKALDAVERGLGPDQQAKVNSMAQSIEIAIRNLQEKPQAPDPDPEKPDPDPEKPNPGPDKPADSEKPQTGGEPAQGSAQQPAPTAKPVPARGAAKTGDETNLTLWLILAGIALCGGAAVVVIKKKHK